MDLLDVPAEVGWRPQHQPLLNTPTLSAKKSTAKQPKSAKLFQWREPDIPVWPAMKSAMATTSSIEKTGIVSPSIA